MKNLQAFQELTQEELTQTSGGYWKTVWAVGPGVEQRNTTTGAWRWVQTQSYSGYTLGTIVNGWFGAAGGDYFVKH